MREKVVKLYRELLLHILLDCYNIKYEEAAPKDKRAKRKVIVQKVWKKDKEEVMNALIHGKVKSPSAREVRKRFYNSASSY